MRRGQEAACHRFPYRSAVQCADGDGFLCGIDRSYFLPYPYINAKAVPEALRSLQRQFFLLLDHTAHIIRQAAVGIGRIRESNEKYREDLYQIRREMETVKERTENVEKRAAAERTELAELRELVFTQANAVEMGGLEPDKAAELRFPYSTRNRVVAFGGHDSCRKAIRPLLPNVTFINREQRPNADMIKAADVVWIQPNALSHRSFYKIINVVRTNQVQIRYFGYASAMKCAVQVLEDDVPTGKS